MTSSLTVALWAMNLAYPVTSLQHWLDVVERQMLAAKKQGAEVILLPEYASEHWLHFSPPDVTDHLMRELRFTDKALPELSALARKHEMLLIAGSFPAPSGIADNLIHNRAHSFFPDGRVEIHNKLCMTPVEKNREGLQLFEGDGVRIFEWKGLRLCVLICLDIELPALSAKLAKENIDVLFVPSMTKKLAGYHRVFDCAKARAVELQAAICVVGVINSSTSTRELNISGASVFLPCEEKFGHTGVLASIPPSYTTENEGSLLVCTLPTEQIRKLRQGEAEVWPGAWTADHVSITHSE